MKIKARAPREEYHNVQEIDKVWPLRQNEPGVAPWMVEFFTLWAVWTMLMPFCFVTAKGPSPALREIHQFSPAFPDLKVNREVWLRVPHFTFVSYKFAKSCASSKTLGIL